jgi:sugar O-acyltransferase (sialic acid O-acetyltransferase NeuD family)
VTLEPILLVGAGGHAKVCIDVIEQEGRFKIIGLVGQADEVGCSLLGYPVLGTDEDLSELISQSPNALVSIGQIKTPEHRMRLYKLLEKNGFNLPKVISPRAYVSTHATVGAGTIVFHGAVINSGAVVGENCIINSLALIEHDVMINDHCHISTGAIINGSAHIGAGVFVGSQSTVRDGITIGEQCFIGMGQQIIVNCEAESRIPQAKEKY